MRRLLLSLVLLSFSVASTSAFTVVVEKKAAQGVIIYRSVEGAKACRDEMQAIKNLGVVCAKNIVAIVTNGTKLSRTSGTGPLGLYDNVTILTGEHAGESGVIASEALDLEEVIMR
jgi:hypothetical protein